jgi:uncharacterized protein (UPF0335 family)
MPKRKRAQIEEEIDDGDQEGAPAGEGHNSGKMKAGGVAADQLKSIIDRIEKLEEEELAVRADKRDVYAEAKGNGFDIKAIRDIIKERKKDRSEVEEHETIVYTYKRALGMLPELEHTDGQED